MYTGSEIAYNFRAGLIPMASIVHGEDEMDLKNKQCEPCEGGVCPLDESLSVQHLEQLPGWQLSDNGKSITRTLKFNRFSETMLFINAMAYMAEQQGHHPDFSAGYGYCEVSYTTHAIGGLSENDFICAAKINDLLDP
jgi:4a-hydroxytetrahydrobiopterin dehydratase